MEWVWSALGLGFVFTILGMAESDVRFVWAGIALSCGSMWLLVGLLLVGAVA